MSADRSTDAKSLPLSLQERIDSVCDRFESAWNAGERPKIEDYVAQCAAAERSALFRELLIVELQCHRKVGEEPSADEYERRFPEHAGVVQEVFRSIEASSHDTSVLATTTGLDIDSAGQPVERRNPGPSDIRLAEEDGPLPEKIGRYQVRDWLGKGGFGTVYLAYDDQLEREVAIKVPRRERVAEPADIDAYLAEARLVAQLRHDHIVEVYDVGQTDDGRCFVVSLYVQGTDLRKRIEAGRPTHVESAQLVATIAEALHYAHRQQITHRDIKPANILVDAAGTPYVADFGLALKDDDFGRGPTVAGTPAYMSPEQARGEGHLVDGRSDIFSLGVVFYELLTGVRPFTGSSWQEIIYRTTTVETRPPRQLDDRIPKELERICLKALSKRTTDRYTTARDLAEDLRHFLSETKVAKPVSEVPTTVEAPQRPIKIVPKGLRSFDEQDADFFLELLPGPRDRNGLPESIRFWKRRIEQRDPAKTFRVGLIYGPSGCGKSSLVKAGLLPLLADDVVPIYVEATPEETEHRLLRALGHEYPEMEEPADLVQFFSLLRRCPAPGHKKLVVVLDQFEQWLYGREDYREQELTRALRQCDGAHLQTIVTVRDDFWMAATRFMRDVDVPLLEGHNSAAVDLFEIPHARKVLVEFGRAHGCLPENLSELAAEQERFLNKACDGMACDGHVIPVQLSLFAEMVKGKAWHADTLKSVGGAEGLAVRFLEETFGAAHAPPEHRLHQKAARQVLAALLPEEGSNLKGNMQTWTQLQQVSGYATRDRDFVELVRMLTDLRLITPSDPAGALLEDFDSNVEAVAGEKYFQLTHDYLVPSLREWLNRKRRETRRGRAELLLEERMQQWAPSQQDRLLPSPLESVQIVLFTRQKHRTATQREMLRRAWLVHGRTLGISALLIMLLAVVLTAVLPQSPSQLEILDRFAEGTSNTETRSDAFDQLEFSNVTIFPRVVEVLKEEKDVKLLRYVLPRLTELEKESSQSGQGKGQTWVRDSLIDLAVSLLHHSESDEICSEGFDLLATLESPVKTLEMIRSRAGSVRGEGRKQTREAMVYYIGRLEWSGLGKEDRSSALQTMTGLISDARNEQLVAAGVTQLDQIEPARLVDWLLEACTSYDEDSAAKQSLIPYAERALAERKELLGKHIEDRLGQLVDRSRGQITSKSEAEFLIQALGHINLLVADQHYERGTELVSYMLHHWERLEAASILDTVIESFVLLREDRETSIQPLREIAQDEDSLWDGLRPVRLAAVTALGDLHDLQSVGLLIGLATDSGPSSNSILQTRALKSLRKIAALLIRENRDDATVARIIATHSRIIEEFDTQPRVVVVEALLACRELRAAWDIESLLALTGKPIYIIDANSAILGIMVLDPEKASDVVQAYIRWKTSGATRPFVPDDPDNAILAFEYCYGVTDETEVAAKAVAHALAEASTVMSEPAERKEAVSILARLVLAKDAPQLDPTANESSRATQFERWERWWTVQMSQFHLTADRLVRTSVTQ